MRQRVALSERETHALGDRIATGFGRVFIPILRRRALERVRNGIECERLRVEALMPSSETDEAQTHLLAVLDEAAAEADIGNIDAAWRRFHTARELGILQLEGAALEAAAEEYRHEARKLNEWRRNAVGALLNPQSSDLPKEKVRRAATIVHEHYQNQAYKDGMRRTYWMGLAMALIFGLAGLLLLAHMGFLGEVAALSADAQPDNLFNVLSCIAIMGFCGAAVSAATTFQSLAQPSRIPELTSTFQMTTLRLALGALSAIVIFVAVRSETFASIFQFEIFGTGYLLFAFVAGFSERLVLRIVTSVTGKSEKPEQ